MALQYSGKLKINKGTNQSPNQSQRSQRVCVSAPFSSTNSETPLYKVRVVKPKSLVIYVCRHILAFEPPLLHNGASMFLINHCNELALGIRSLCPQILACGKVIKQ